MVLKGLNLEKFKSSRIAFLEGATKTNISYAIVRTARGLSRPLAWQHLSRHLRLSHMLAGRFLGLIRRSLTAQPCSSISHLCSFSAFTSFSTALSLRRLGSLRHCNHIFSTQGASRRGSLGIGYIEQHIRIICPRTC